MEARLQSADGAPALVIGVQDSGRGIPPEQLPVIFDLFSQSGVRAQTHEDGLGLGLSIARRLVEMHGGRITASSGGRNRGSEFVLTLPLPATQSSVVAAAEAPATSLRKLRALVVDDNHDAADSMSMLVEFAGAETRTAYSAAEAFSLMPTFAPRVPARHRHARHGLVYGLPQAAQGAWSEQLAPVLLGDPLLEHLAGLHALAGGEPIDHDAAVALAGHARGGAQIRRRNGHVVEQARVTRRQLAPAADLLDAAGRAGFQRLPPAPPHASSANTSKVFSVPPGSS